MKYIFFFICFLNPHNLQYEKLLKKYFVVWNVGQGQWLSLIENKKCQHFDMGGEFFPKNIFNICSQLNSLTLTHLDFDHSNFIKKSLKKLHCLDPQLNIHIENKNKKFNLNKKTQYCQTPQSDFISIFNPRRTESMTQSNDLSFVYLVKNQVLISGDSTQKAEKLWLHHPSLATARVLILGHHGSKTSTSDQLLNKLPELKIAVSSARFMKYGHPHPMVLMKLKEKKIPHLSTQDWGNIFIEI